MSKTNTLINDPFNKLAIILPTYNVGNELRQHLDVLSPILQRVGQVIAVDSYSEDDTYTLLKDRLNLSNCIIYQRPRGLYESWNSAIRKVNVPYTYISTIGDLPDCDRLEAFFRLFVDSGAEFAISPPEIVKRGHNGDLNSWAIHRWMEKYELRESLVIGPELMREINYYCLSKYGLSSISGSFASNISKTELLLQNPFPTEFRGAGDMVWWFKVSSGISTFMYPEPISTFLVHESSYSHLSLDESYNLYAKLYAYYPPSIACKNAQQMLHLRDYLRGMKKKHGLTRYLIGDYNSKRRLKKKLLREMDVHMQDTEERIRFLYPGSVCLR